MKKIVLKTNISELKDESELSLEDQRLIKEAKKAQEAAYAPYSEFKVGAALELDSGEVFIGSNQENAAYPSGLCAERVALFSASANHPEAQIKTLVITAKNQKGHTTEPIYPCGSCRQVILESQERQDHPIRVILAGSSKIHVVEKANELLPMNFNKTSLLGN